MGLQTLRISQPNTDIESQRHIDMVVTFITEDQDGFHTYTGHVVSRGPATIVLMLTEPFSMAGRSVQFPMTQVVEEKIIA
jgi:hypothetical protein